MRNLINLPVVRNVSPDSDFVIEIPLGMTYDFIQLILGGTTFTPQMMTNIKVKLNGKTFREYKDLSELDAENSYWNRGPEAAGVHTLWFERPELTNRDERRRYVFGTQNNPDGGVVVSTFTIEGHVTTGAVNPSLRVKAMQSAPRFPGLVTAIRNFSCGTTVSGTFEIADLPKPIGARIMAAHFVSATADNIGGLELLLNGNLAVDADTAELRDIQLKYKRGPQPNTLHFDPVLQGAAAESLIVEGLSDMRFKLRMGNADTVNTRVEYSLPVELV